LLSFAVGDDRIKRKGKERMKNIKSHKLVIFHVIVELAPYERILTMRDMAVISICIKFGVEKLRG